MRGYFAHVRRAGFDIGLSTGKLTKAMVEVLFQLPPEATPSKELVVQHLGLLGQMSKSRDINAAWNSAKRQVVRDRPERFCLDGKVLRWATTMWRVEPVRSCRQPATASSPPSPRRKG